MKEIFDFVRAAAPSHLGGITCSVFAMVMLHLQILQEERYLEKNFGESYREYRQHVFRYLGRR